MREESKLRRQAEIEKAAYDLLQREGYGSISMLKIARKAKASNETLYRWYGDKSGLFKALVARNADDARLLLTKALETQRDPIETLALLGPVLLSILLSPQAIALNQAAAADTSGELGKALAQSGRESILPLITEIFGYAEWPDAKENLDARGMAELYVTLLVGDMQIRRVIGQMAQPDSAWIEARSARAVTHLEHLLGTPQAPER